MSNKSWLNTPSINLELYKRGWAQSFLVEHVEFVYKTYVPCLFEEPSVKALKAVSIGFLYVTLGNAYGVTLKKS